MSNLNLPQQSKPASGLICAGQPEPGQYALAADEGVTCVISLRRTEETPDRDLAAEVEATGMSFVHIPIAGPADLNRENAEALAEAISGAEGDVLVHCGSSNRVGALLALKAHWLDGVAVDKAIAFGKSAGLTGMSDAVATILE